MYNLQQKSRQKPAQTLKNIRPKVDYRLNLMPPEILGLK